MRICIDPCPPVETREGAAAPLVTISCVVAWPPEAPAAGGSKPPIGIPTLPQHHRGSVHSKAAPQGGVRPAARDGGATGAIAASAGTKARTSSPKPRSDATTHTHEALQAQPPSLPERTSKQMPQAPPQVPHHHPTHSTTLPPTQSRAHSSTHPAPQLALQPNPRPVSARGGTATTMAGATTKLPEVPPMKVRPWPRLLLRQPSFWASRSPLHAAQRA